VHVRICPPQHGCLLPTVTRQDVPPKSRSITSSPAVITTQLLLVTCAVWLLAYIFFRAMMAFEECVLVHMCFNLSHYMVSASNMRCWLVLVICGKAICGGFTLSQFLFKLQSINNTVHNTKQ
jgi:hypothetical protein